MLRIYSGEPEKSPKLSTDPSLPDPRFLAEQDFRTVSELCASHDVKTGHRSVEFKLLPGESLMDLVQRGADVTWRCLNETGVHRDRLRQLQLSGEDEGAVSVNFKRRVSLARERHIAVVVLDPRERGSKREFAALKRAGFTIGNEIDATAASLLYRLETGIEGLRGAIEDAAYSASSGLPVDPRWTQRSLFLIVRCSDGLLRYSSSAGVVDGDFGKFETRLREFSPILMVKVSERPVGLLGKGPAERV